MFLYRTSFIEDPSFKSFDKKALNASDLVDRTESFLKYISSKGLTNSVQIKNYVPFVDAILGDFNRFRFDEEGEGSYKDHVRILVRASTEPALAPVRAILLKAIEIEMDAESKNQIPLFRYSHLTSKTVLAKKMELLDAAILNDNSRFAVSGLSFGTSLLAAFKGDGAVASLYDQKVMSACVFSYFLGSLRDHLFQKDLLPGPFAVLHP